MFKSGELRTRSVWSRGAHLDQVRHACARSALLVGLVDGARSSSSLRRQSISVYQSSRRPRGSSLNRNNFDDFLVVVVVVTMVVFVGNVVQRAAAAC